MSASEKYDNIMYNLYSHKLQLQKQDFFKKEKDTHNVSKNTMCVECILTMRSGSAR